MAEDKNLHNVEDVNPDKENVSAQEEYSLNDDRRVKVLSPGAMVAKRFFRNRTAVFGMAVLIIMFIFSFIGGLITPYGESELFYRVDYQQKEYASAIENKEYRYKGTADFSAIVQAQMLLAINSHKDSFTWDKINYYVAQEADNLYRCSNEAGELIGIAYKAIFNPAKQGTSLELDALLETQKAYANGGGTYTVGGETYVMDAEGNITKDGEDFGYISVYNIQALMSDVFLSREFKEQVIAEIEAGVDDFVFTDVDGVEHEYKLAFVPANNRYTITQATETRVYDRYSAPSKEHPFGTDKNGMDVMTRLMYGGRVSLVIGFVVEFIATAIALILGGIAGYFGGWVDNLIMRIVDIFYCIPSMPILIIIGAAMDNASVPPKTRMIYLMLILGVLGWPGLARLIRGQILSLREQEFMTATEATGLSYRRRIFQHLIPNVVPQTIVSVTMGLGGTILTESSLSFLGLGVRFPFASWGNIINDVNDTYVLQHYLFIWIPAGVLLLATVLAFNLVGDGLRDAFDPKMKR
ncbi:MAG: ABC transporter permease [Clostridia bacterium]|nr:ABC transporter permease [Clostridia bacterium]MBR0445629.1 ABC transporter permease [Clostridia bacterium]